MLSWAALLFGGAAVIRAIAKYNQSVADLIRALTELIRAIKKNRR
ncbi:hypothetical protein HMPREF0496_0999 [Lentilactobacillus hilgardii ATCC 27305]|nr:hypothetical protein HMPREF0496_0999 [Lentilactobacillus hilgardii ATCC 27305]